MVPSLEGTQDDCREDTSFYVQEGMRLKDAGSIRLIGNRVCRKCRKIREPVN
jgi:hypothetical protein